ncbi:hypothetical protein [Anaerostipes butyraticus]|uniref:hypothetical protein n=1 Tax=Anaerostipes butyraticus TaxID=645466 RepID=UPI0035F025B9
MWRKTSQRIKIQARRKQTPPVMQKSQERRKSRKFVLFPALYSLYLRKFFYFSSHILLSSGVLLMKAFSRGGIESFLPCGR